MSLIPFTFKSQSDHLVQMATIMANLSILSQTIFLIADILTCHCMTSTGLLNNIDTDCFPF